MHNLQIHKKYLIVAGILGGIILLVFVFWVTTPVVGNKSATDINLLPTSSVASSAGSNNDTQNRPALRLPLTFHSLIPGRATYDDVISSLGNPNKSLHSGDYTLAYYVVRGTESSNILIFKNNLLQYIVEQKVNSTPLFSQYKTMTKKTEDGVLYDMNEDNSGFNLYVFAKDGIAFLDNPDSDQTSQVHYFIPSDYQTFLVSEGVFLHMIHPPTPSASSAFDL